MGAGLLGPSPTPAPLRRRPQSRSGSDNVSKSKLSLSPHLPHGLAAPNPPPPQAGESQSGFPQEIRPRSTPPDLRSPQTGPEILGRDTESKSQAAQLSSPPAQSLSPLQFSSARQKGPVRGMGNLPN